MAIRYFEIIGALIDRGVERLERETGVPRPQLYERIRKTREPQRSHSMPAEAPAPAEGTDADGLSARANDLLNRLNYMYSHGSIAASIAENIIGRAGLDTYLEGLHRRRGFISVCLLSGGPGLELLGLARLLENRPAALRWNIRYQIIDAETGWERFWTETNQAIDLAFHAERDGRHWAPAFIGGITRVGQTRGPASSDYGVARRLASYDLYVHACAFSDLDTRANSHRPLLTEIMRQAAPEARFLFIDSHENARDMRWQESVREFTLDAGVQFTRPFSFCNVGMEGIHDPAHIGESFSRHRQPRASADVFWATGVKVGKTTDKSAGAVRVRTALR